jgi:hypothetical protein
MRTGSEMKPKPLWQTGPQPIKHPGHGKLARGSEESKKFRVATHASESTSSGMGIDRSSRIGRRRLKQADVLDSPAIGPGQAADHRILLFIRAYSGIFHIGMLLVQILQKKLFFIFRCAICGGLRGF